MVCNKFENRSGERHMLLNLCFLKSKTKDPEAGHAIVRSHITLRQRSYTCDAAHNTQVLFYHSRVWRDWFYPRSLRGVTVFYPERAALASQCPTLIFSVRVSMHMQ